LSSITSTGGKSTNRKEVTMFLAALALVRVSRASQSYQTPAIRPYLLRFIAHDGTRSVVAFANRDERDERGAQLLTLGTSVTLATARGCNMSSLAI
jgi:hypothetical protein